MTPFRWGILGTGNIAKQFARGLAALPDHRLVAVGSRSAESAQRFASEFRVERAHASYEALAADAGVDAVYVATPHPQHRANTVLCLEAGRHVLCEKPFAVNAADAEAMAATARRCGRFLMEAMWTRFLPVSRHVRRWLADGAIGDARLVHADFGFRCGWDPRSRLLDPALAGGGLLDVGVYTLAWARMAFGAAPLDVLCAAHRGETGVDEQAALIATYPGGRLASLTCAVRTSTVHDARIDGTAGRIHVPDFWRATRAELVRDGGGRETVELPFRGNGYECQAEEVARCVRAGLGESPELPLAETVETLRAVDAARARIGLRYPFE